MKSVTCLFAGSPATKGNSYAVKDVSTFYLLIEIAPGVQQWIDRDFFTKY